MKNNCYNEVKLKKAISHIKNNPWTAKELLENYIDKYPKDYNGRIYYINTLITLNIIDDAVKYMNDLIDEVNENNLFLKNNNYDKFVSSLFPNMIKILATQGKYEKIYSLIQENISWFDYQHHSLKFFCEVKLGIINKDNIDMSSLTYIEKQIIDYDEEALVNHLIKHLPEGNIDRSKINKNIFSPNFDLNRVLQEIKKYIPSDNKLISTPLSDYYIFKYNDCGREENKITDYFKVICFPNTDKIITMLPISNNGNVQTIDLNYLTENKPSNNISQIDKFNKRFNKSTNPKIKKLRKKTFL